jgi:eukaryotic-like serine/threonine-protein kinase
LALGWKGTVRREVAIKVLPAAFSADPDRLLRFEQEARAAAALNPPNIPAVYDIGALERSRDIVSELLEGQKQREVTSAGEPTLKKLIN